jgi:integrase
LVDPEGAAGGASNPWICNGHIRIAEQSFLRLRCGCMIGRGVAAWLHATFGEIYKQTGNLRAVQILLGHSKIETTVRYLGVEVEDALTLAEATEV